MLNSTVDICPTFYDNKFKPTTNPKNIYVVPNGGGVEDVCEPEQRKQKSGSYSSSVQANYQDALTWSESSFIFKRNDTTMTVLTLILECTSILV